MVQGENNNPSTGRTTAPGSASLSGLDGKMTTAPENTGAYHDFRRNSSLSGQGPASTRSEATSAIKADIRKKLDIKNNINNSLEDKLVTGVANKTSDLGRGLKTRTSGVSQAKEEEKEYMQDQWKRLGLEDHTFSQEQYADAVKLQRMIEARSQANPLQSRQRDNRGGVAMPAGQDMAAKSAEVTAKELKAAQRAQVMQMVHAQTGGGAGAAEGFKAGAVQDTRKAMEKEVVKRLDKDMNLKQKAALKMATYAAGKKAINVLAAVAEKMAKQAEKGGAMGFLMINMTYLMALIKDIIDIAGAVIPFWGVLFGFALGIIITIFWLMICGSSHGFIDRFIVKTVCRFLAFLFLDGIPVANVLPLFLLMNAWTHWDYIKAIKKAERAFEDITQQIFSVQKDVRRTANGI